MDADIPHVAGVDHEFVSVGGLRTHVALAGDGPPVLMLHGWPQHWYLWRDVIPLVAPHARAIAPDFRGFGWTEVPERGYEKHQLMRDMLALLDELEIEKATIAGHDWGGYVGFLLALEHPGRVAGLLALNVLPPWPSRDPRTALDAWRFMYMPVLSTPGLGGLIGRTLGPRGIPEPARSAFAARLGGERARATERLYRTFLRELPGLIGRYTAAGLRVPTRVLFGMRDVVLTVRAARDAFGQADAVELELVADATHFIVDEKPELVAGRLLGLLPRER
ncbi:MAG TPA: alpha/beta hydrolase [Thermoleophilaceae bacterium]|nr:alpha/beta hydrolase [Thermoleophilaceae bacterium]